MSDSGATLRGGDYQQRFQRRWPQLRDPHVRALAWLLDAPDLMDPDAPCWAGRIASLGPVSDDTAAWLNLLQDDPERNARLHAHMAHQPSARLGRYAEKLLGFYLAQRGQLVAANLQVRNNGATRETLGEFDFLVKRPDAASACGLEHWEFATKFYLLESKSPASDGEAGADAFLGPNLADSLGRKMRKIMQQQLMLSQHPAAAAVLPESVASAQALVKGWLFYRDDASVLDARTSRAAGIAAGHCRGFWCDAGQLQQRAFAAQVSFVLMPRLEWLAPLRASAERALALPDLLAALQARFVVEEAPVMVAVCRSLEGAESGEVIEVERGFIVPDGWQQRAAETLRHAIIKV